MFAKKILTPLFLFLILALAVKTAQAQTTDDELKEAGTSAATAPSKSRLEGTWLTTVTFSDGFELKVLFTFIPGKDENEGTLIDQNEFQFTPPACTADQGVWARTSNFDFIATHFAFCFDPENDNSPNGSVKVRDTIKVNSRGDGFTGRQYIEILDSNGQVVVTFEANMVGMRLRAEAPPPPSLFSKSATTYLQKYLRLKREK
jgi:hypothetical protein